MRANTAVFVHSGVSEERVRVRAIERLGAPIVRVEDTYDASVVTALRVSSQNGWFIMSDTSWPGYERLPGLVM